MIEQYRDLKNGVVLAELGGRGDGPYCARHGDGAALVMLGSYIVDARDDVPYPEPFVFKPGRVSYAKYLQEHIAAARQSGARVGVSVVSVDIADSVDFLQAAEDAGADYASLCLHSTMEMFVSVGLSSALCRRENWGGLSEWIGAMLSAVKIPFIAKIGVTDAPDVVESVDVMADAGVKIVHANVGKLEAGAERLGTLRQLSGRCDFLIGGGGIVDVEGARRYLDAGADAVAIGKAAMDDPTLCARVQEQLLSMGSGLQ